MAIKKKYLVEKRNILNELRSNNMSLQELRFFSIYLSRINPRNIETRVVSFSLNDFQRIMNFGKLNLNQIRSATDSLLCKIIHVPLDDGGYDSFQLFKRCKLKKENDEWVIEIDAHDEALPLMFEFKTRYFVYELWNALRLKSSNQLRMYEILKQYEMSGERVLSIDELKSLLGIDCNEHKIFNNFKVRVLDSCQEALQKWTDIKFTYEPTGRKGKGGKILNLKFIITKNTNYTDQLSLAEFIQSQDIIDVEAVAADETQPLTENTDLEDAEDDTPGNENLEFLADACNNEFSFVELQVLYNLIIQIVPYSRKGNTLLEHYNYLKRRYDELVWRASREKISRRFGYLKKMIEADVSQ